MNPKWIDWIDKLDGGGQLGALISILLIPLTFLWLIADLFCQRFSLGTWNEWQWNGWKKPSSKRQRS